MSHPLIEKLVLLAASAFGLMVCASELDKKGLYVANTLGEYVLAYDIGAAYKMAVLTPGYAGRAK